MKIKTLHQDLVEMALNTSSAPKTTGVIRRIKATFSPRVAARVYNSEISTIQKKEQDIVSAIKKDPVCSQIYGRLLPYMTNPVMVQKLILQASSSSNPFLTLSSEIATTVMDAAIKSGISNSQIVSNNPRIKNMVNQISTGLALNIIQNNSKYSKLVGSAFSFIKKLWG